MPLFEVAILESPTKKQAEDGATEKLILAPTPVVAADAQGAAMQIAMTKQQELSAADPARMNVLVRPFA